jgi:hypothetical protein
VFVLTVTIASALATPATARPSIEQVTVQDGRLMVNGEPFLAIGLYHAAHWHRGHAEAGKQGFNLLQCYGSTPEELWADLDKT